jgi:hypothetical protein
VPYLLVEILKNTEGSMTRQLSSSWTLIMRIFVPTLWIAFFGTFFLSVLFTTKSQVGGLNTSNLGIGLGIFLIVFIFIFYKTLFRLKRIDATPEYMYVTNYLKSVRYKHEYIQKIETSKGFLFSYGTLVLKEKALFGDRIPFIVSRKRLEIFVEENPELNILVEEVK